MKNAKPTPPDARKLRRFLWTGQQKTPLWWVVRYGLAVGAVAAGLGLRLALTAWVGPGLATYLTFYPAVMAAALLGGLGPGLVATACTGFVAAYWILPPVGFAVETPVDRLGLAIFTGMGLFMSVVAEFYRRHRHKAAAYDREAVLRESQARLATFAAASFEGIVQSEAGVILDCNEQYARMFGYSVAELKGMEIASLAAPEDRDRVGAVLRQGRESAIEHAGLRKDGTRIVIEAHGRPVSPGSPTRHSAVRDVTERKRAQAALQRERNLLRTLIDLIPDSVYVRDAQDRFLLANATLARNVGVRSPEEMLGKTDADFFNASTSALFRADDQRVLAGETILNKEEQVVSPAGGERVVLTTKVPFKDSDGVVVGLVGIGRDITDRKRAQEALRESEVRYRTLFNTIDAGFCVIEMIFDAGGKPADYRFLEVNAAFETQTGLHGAEGKLMRELAPAHQAHWFEIYGRIALTGEPVRFVNEARQLNRWYDVYAYRIGAPERRHVAILFNDISAHKQAEAELRRRAEELRAANDELTRFNRVTVGRELRIIELKQQVNELRAELGQPPRYKPEPGEEAKPKP